MGCNNGKAQNSNLQIQSPSKIPTKRQNQIAPIQMSAQNTNKQLSNSVRNFLENSVENKQSNSSSDRSSSKTLKSMYLS